MGLDADAHWIRIRGENSTYSTLYSTKFLQIYKVSWGLVYTSCNYDVIIEHWFETAIIVL